MKKLLSAVLVTAMIFALAIGAFANATYGGESLDNIYVNGAQMFDGGAADWLAANEIKGKLQTLGVRGWSFLGNGNNEAISTFGYKIDDGEAVKVDDSVVFDQALVNALGGRQEVRRFYFTADVTKVGLGEHTFTIVVWNDADESVDLKTTFTFTQELDPDEEPEPLPPAIAGNALDAWQYWQDGALVAPAATFVRGTIQGFHIAGWFGFNYPALAVGYRINGTETFVDGAINYNPEQAVKDAGGANAVRYSMDGSFDSLNIGSNDFDIIVKLDDPKQSVVDLFSNIASIISPANDDAVWFYNPAANYLASGLPYSTGYWIGPNAGFADGGNITAKFTTPDSFDGVYEFTYASAGAEAAVIEISLYDADDALLETVNQTFNGDACAVTRFSKVYPAGTYTLDYVFASGGHFVLGSGEPTENKAVMGGTCNNQYPEAAPAIALLKADMPPAELIKATLDIFDLGNGVLTVQGWAGANYPANNLGYRVDDGEDVLDGIEFANFNTPDEADIIRNLAGPDAFRFKTAGAGIALDLEPGEHTITLLMRVNDGMSNHIVEMKSKKFTVTGEPDPAELVGMSFNTVWVDGTKVCDVGDASAFLAGSPIVDAGAVGFRGWAHIKNSSIESFGYRIDDGEPVLDAAYIQNRPDVQAAFGVSAEQVNGFMVSPIDVSALEPGDHTIVIVVKAADGSILDVVAIPVSVSEPPAPAPELVAQNLDLWAHYNRGADCAAASVFDYDAYEGFHIAGWVGFNYEIARVGYRLNGVEVFPETVTITEGEAAVKDLAGEYAVCYDMYGSFEGAVVGVNELVWIAELNDDAHSVVDFVGPYNFTCTDIGETAHPNTNLFTATHPTAVSGWWTGTVIGLPVGGSLRFTFDTPWAFNGICYMMYANNATVDINVYNESGILVDTVRTTYAADGVPSEYFNKSFAPGVYTVEFVFVDGGYFVFASGTANNIPVEVAYEGYIPNGDTLVAPVAFLIGANNPGQPVAPNVLNAAYDELHYDANVLCSSKAYTWVADPANREALDFEKASVSEIYMKGWAYIDKPIMGFGYRIDGGDVVMGDFIVDRAAELAAAGFDGAQGFGVTVPVETLMTGDHTIEVIVIDEDGMFAPVVKVKNDVVYPVGVTCTVTPILDHESVLTDWHIDKYAVDGVELTQGNPGNADRNIIDKYQQAYALTDNNTVTITGWAGFDGEYVETFGYRINGESVTDPGFIVNRNAELAGAGFPYGQGFGITFDYSGFEPGEYTVEFFATALDEVENVFYSYTFTVSEIGTWLYDETQPIPFGQGWSTGYNVNSDYADGDVNVAFETPNAFDGVYTIYFAAFNPGAVMDVNLYDENDELLETVRFSYMNNGWGAIKFANVYGPGSYTLQYALDPEVQSHFFLAAGEPNEIETAVFGKCYAPGDFAPGIGLLYAEIPVTESTGNAALDEFKYDGADMGTGSLYKWINDPANAEALSFEEGAVSSIYFRGWAQLTAPIAGFGYIIDDGEVVTDPAFVQDRAAELEGAGFPGAQGYVVSVPVADLKAGEHTIKVVAIDEAGTAVQIIKTKSEVDYPIAITFTVTEAVPELYVYEELISVVKPKGYTFKEFAGLPSGLKDGVGEGYCFFNFNIGDVMDPMDEAGAEAFLEAQRATIGDYTQLGFDSYTVKGAAVTKLDYRWGAADIIQSLVRVHLDDCTVVITFATLTSIDGALEEFSAMIDTLDVLVEIEIETELLNAAFDDLWYDEIKLCEAKAYMWVVEHAEELNYEEGTVSQIYFRGWAQLNKPIAGFGYVIDNGEVVSMPEFIQDRAAELAAAGFEGGQGYAIWVPVEDLAEGDHFIKIVAIDEEGTAVDIYKAKGGVEYPVAINFTVTESGPEYKLGDVNKDGEVDNKDVVVLFRYISANDDYVAEYDINGDGAVDNKDVVVLFRMVSAD